MPVSSGRGDFLGTVSGLFVLLLLVGCQGLFVGGTLDSGPGVEPRVVERQQWPGFAEKREALLARYSADGEKGRAAAFLMDNLPLVDLVAMDVANFAENIDYAFKARSVMGWGDRVSWADFLHYVLPHRISQEPYQPWRRQFYEELAPLVADCPNMAAAVLELNKWVLGEAGFIRSRPWDQGLLSTIRRGGGRCEEKSALLIAAARSVGIPARYAYTPRWQFMDDNHAWVEVWADGGWHFVGSAEPRVALGQTSFNHRLEWVALVLASAYGRQVDGAGENVYRRGRDFTLYNVTSLYVPVGRLEVAVSDELGVPVPGGEVFVSLYNYGSLRPIARLLTDENGTAGLELGRTTVMVSVARGDKSDFALVEVSPDGVVRAELVLDGGNVAKGDFRFRFGAGPGEANETKVGAGVAALKAQCKVLEAGRKERLGRFLKLVESSDLDGNLTAALAGAAGGAPELLAAIGRSGQEGGDVLREYVLRADPKDLLDVRGEELLAEIDLAIAARNIMADYGLVYDDETFHRWVLDGRVYYESFSHWRKDLVEYIKSWPRQDLASLVEKVGSYAGSLPRARASYLGPLLNPGQVVGSGLVSVEVERLIVAVALLRAAGVPARYDEDNERLEYFDGADWQPVDLAKSGASTRETGVDDGGVVVGFFCEGGKSCSGEMEYYKDFTISRFGQRGLWQSLKPDGEFDDEDGVYRFSLPVGEYSLVIGRRNEAGEPLVRIIPFAVGAGEDKLLAVDLADIY